MKDDEINEYLKRLSKQNRELIAEFDRSLSFMHWFIGLVMGWLMAVVYVGITNDISPMFMWPFSMCVLTGVYFRGKKEKDRGLHFRDHR